MCLYWTALFYVNVISSFSQVHFKFAGFVMIVCFVVKGWSTYGFSQACRYYLKTEPIKMSVFGI